MKKKKKKKKTGQSAEVINFHNIPFTAKRKGNFESKWPLKLTPMGFKQLYLNVPFKVTLPLTFSLTST